MLQTQQNELIRRVDAATTSAVQARLTQKRRLEKQLQIEARLLSEANARQTERCVHLLDEEEQAAQVKSMVQALLEEAHHDDQVGKQAEARARELRASIVLHHGGGGSVPHAAY
jgi:CHAT domain-containing protein